jgi:hypothetical protein
MITLLAIIVAVLFVGSLGGILVFAVTQEDKAAKQTEQDAIDRKVAAQQITDGLVLHVRRAGRIP